MRPVTRDEILDYETYSERRQAIRAQVMHAKNLRRAHVGGVLTFLFENHETVRYQILEMVRAEHMVREDDIRREVDTYNELLGGPGELGCTLLIELDDPAARTQALRAWRNLPEHCYLKLADGRRVRPRFDDRQRGEERLSSVQFFIFDTEGQTPVAVGCDLPDLSGETALSDAQRQALATDLGVPLAPSGAAPAPTK